MLPNDDYVSPIPEEYFDAIEPVIDDPKKRIYFDHLFAGIISFNMGLSVNEEEFNNIAEKNFSFDIKIFDIENYLERNELVDAHLRLKSLLEGIESLPHKKTVNMVLDEVDENMSNFKTDRQKDYYLSRFSDYTSIYSEILFNRVKKLIKIHFSTKQTDYDKPIDFLRKCFEVVLTNQFKTNCTLLESTIAVILYYRTILTDLEEYVNKIRDQKPEKEIKLDHEIKLDSHRLIAFYQLGLFEPLYKKHYNTIGPVKFTKLIGTILGIDDSAYKGFRPTVSRLIKEHNNKNSKTEENKSMGSDKKVQTDSALNKVAAFFSELGIKLETEREV